MARKNIVIKIALSFMLVLAVMHYASALGITPGRTTIQFESGLKKTVDVKVLNNEKKDMKVTLFARGDLSDYITISEDSLDFAKDDEEKTFTYDINLPENINEPGLKETDIVAREIPKEEDSTGTTVSALVAVVSQLHVNVPYPGKFLSIDLFISDAKQGEKTQFFIPVKNLGDEDIQDAKAIIIIYDPKGSEITRFSTSSISIGAKSGYEFSLDWNAEISSGVYKAAGIVEYDGQRVSSEKQFIVGEFFLKPLDISVNNFKLGQIAKFNILVENVGNILVENAKAEIKLSQDSGRMVADLSSIPDSISAGQKKEVPIYWDTAEVTTGLYSGTLKLSYDDKFSEKQIRALIEDNAIKTEIIGVTGFAISSGSGSGFQIKPLYIVFAVLALANIVWMVYYKKKHINAPPSTTQK